MDRYDPKTRSAVMSQIKSRNTGLEEKFRAMIRGQRLGRYRRCVDALPGRPDFVFSRARVAIFIDSCFWHGCPLHLRTPQSNQTYWQQKISSNQERDKAQTEKLKAEGWRVVRVWEHELANEDAVLSKIRNAFEPP